jgi:hypothetical protein
MPAVSPRFTITVAPHTNDTLKRLAAIQGRPVASIIREVLDDAAPIMAQLADTMEALGAAREAARAEITEGMAEAANDLQPHLDGILGHLRAVHDLVSDPSESTGADSARSAGADTVGRAARPPACNTGVVKW